MKFDLLVFEFIIKVVVEKNLSTRLTRVSIHFCVYFNRVSDRISFGSDFFFNTPGFGFSSCKIGVAFQFDCPDVTRPYGGNVTALLGNLL